MLGKMLSKILVAKTDINSPESMCLMSPYLCPMFHHSSGALYDVGCSSPGSPYIDGAYGILKIICADRGSLNE
jgi:hypothetical protein